VKPRPIALATAFALSNTFALTQAGSGSGADVPENSGAVVNSGSGVVGTTNNGAHRRRDGSDGFRLGSK
jgi:hypothetical protein